jgi:hypothetical protein
MDKSQKAWVWVGIVAVVVLVVVFLIWEPRQSSKPTGVVAVHAPQGQVVSGFPTNLLLGTSTSVSDSYSINYSSSTNQYTAEWNSSSSMQSLFANYQKYLPANGWTVGGTITNYPTLRGLNATNASGTINLSIVAQGKGSQVTLTYVEK